MSTTFNPKPQNVIERTGNSVVVENDGVEVKRNITHVKKFEDKDESIHNSAESNVMESVIEDTGTITGEGGKENVVEMKDQKSERCANTESFVKTRPVRELKLPSKFKDFVM